MVVDGPINSRLCRCVRDDVCTVCVRYFPLLLLLLLILFFSFLVTSMRREKSIPPHFPLFPLPRVSMCVSVSVCVSECVCVRQPCEVARVRFFLLLDKILPAGQRPITGSNVLAAKMPPNKFLADE